MEKRRWRVLYEEAVLELEPTKLKERIGAAFAAIEARRLELPPSSEEHQRLAAAKRTLEILDRLKPES